jgi:formylglycine-generating enzyme
VHLRYALFAALLACAPEVEVEMTPPPFEPGPSESTPLDAGIVADAAPVELDAAIEDAETIDASVLDTGVSSDAGIECSVMGRAGECLDVSDCTGDRAPTPGFCPGPTWVQCCTAAPMVCDETAQPRPNEGLVEVAYDDCPAGMIGVDTFCIDRFEASLMEGTRSWSPYFNPGSRTVRAVSIEGAVPQGYIDETQSAAACSNAGKRLCSSAEWLRACQGAAGDTYPYGSTRMPGVCNDDRAVHPAVEYFMSSESWIWSELGNPCINQLERGLARTGAYAGCVSAEGVSDLMGNLHEWIDDSAGTFRGGFYVDTVVNGEGCLYRTIAHGTSHWDYSTGFRCCADR